MARQYTQLKSSIWSDREFTALPSPAQRVYLLAKSQANVSWCGVVPFTEKRWAAMAPDTTTGVICDAINVLEDRGYVVLDPETEELWVRSWVKHNGVMDQPNLRKAMRAAYESILSTAIKRAVYDSLPETEKEQVTTPPEAQPNPSRSPREVIRRPECVGQEQDLDLQQHTHRESGVAPKGPLKPDVPATALSLLSDAKHASHGAEVDGHLMALIAVHGPDAVERAVQTVDASLGNARFGWPSDVRKALEAELGPEAKPHPLDEAQRAQRAAMVDMSEPQPWTEPPVETDEERAAFIAKQRAEREEKVNG